MSQVISFLQTLNDNELEQMSDDELIQLMDQNLIKTFKLIQQHNNK